MIDLTGRVFGRLTITEKSFYTRNGRVVWLYKCRCGDSGSIVTSNALTKPDGTRSCGSCRDQVKHPIEYSAWSCMQSRCYTPSNKDYHNYGGRGIRVCARWREDFLNFLDDMGERPASYLSVDRIENEDNYEPNNCKWSTRSEQQLNKRTSIKNR